MAQKDINTTQLTSYVKPVDGLVHKSVSQQKSDTHEVQRKTPKELRDIFSDFDAITVRQRTKELHVEFPYNKEMNAHFKKMRGARFDARKKFWRVRLHSWERVRELAVQIQELADKSWHDAFITDYYLDHNDLQLTVSVTAAGEFSVDKKVRYQQRVYQVTYVGKPFDTPEGTMVHVFLVDPESLIDCDGAGEIDDDIVERTAHT